MKMMEGLELQPQFVSAIWGGRRLADLPGAPADGPIAEVWLASDIVNRPTRIVGGTHQGKSMREAGVSFPLLVKLIDAELPLSVQVHPDDTKALAIGAAPNGKTEAWVVLAAQPGSRIYAGLHPGVNRDQVVAALDHGELEKLVHSFEPHVGDLVFLPAGTVHALGGGITVFELQQSCDVTYRLFDWNRLDPKTGQGRPLHIDKALDCTDFSKGPIQPVRTEPKSIDCDFFRLAVHRHAMTLGGDGRTRLFFSYQGATRGCIDLEPNKPVLVPSMQGECRLTPDADAWLIECVVP